MVEWSKSADLTFPEFHGMISSQETETETKIPFIADVLDENAKKILNAGLTYDRKLSRG